MPNPNENRRPPRPCQYRVVAAARTARAANASLPRNGKRDGSGRSLQCREVRDTLCAPSETEGISSEKYSDREQEVQPNLLMKYPIWNSRLILCGLCAYLGFFSAVNAFQNVA